MDERPEGDGRTPNPSAPSALLSDEPTVELIIKARSGDAAALDALLQRCLPPLRRFAHGRLPAAARAEMDTNDLVQEAAMNALRKLATFEPRSVGAMQAYLRTAVINRVRDEIRKVARRPFMEEMSEDLASRELSPLEHAIREESYERYTRALSKLRSRDREIIVGRLEAQWSLAELAERFGYSNTNAARLATVRAVQRLAAELGRVAPRTKPAATE
jgi:RNA polymerase sigma-70 factor, ECF subfamily